MTTHLDVLEQSLDRVTAGIIQRFDALSTARDHAVTNGRQVIRHSANAVRALHRSDQNKANTLLQEARALLDAIRETAPHHS